MTSKIIVSLISVVGVFAAASCAGSSTLEKELMEVALQPGASGEFSIWLNGSCMWDRKRNGGFPELKALKQSIRDVVAQDKDLGHSDAGA